ncbi:hypothetical protein CUZ56_02525 [Saezia sanguinis]|uniref:Sulfur carrier protein ThiS n=1 Tax=Saezia sanguinis TaxID=1965230 RepID=A0A433SB21_9BURK|nr:sulfur carrier protein ThiS [Saezia sanguinis]RUS65925.1 hypothetical protein CUZ56_02525 [Saezia sanguinis]
MGTTITIMLNGEPQQLPAMTLAAFVSLIGEPASLATAVNGEFVARDVRAAYQLKEGDEVMTFQPITGG